MTPKDYASHLFLEVYGFANWLQRPQIKAIAIFMVKEIMKQKPREPQGYTSVSDYYLETIKEIEKI